METKLFIALTTTHGVMQTGFLPGVLDYFKDRPVPTLVLQYTDPYIIMARNSAATDFLATDFTHLLFIDADIMFVAEHVKKLLEDDVDIVGGLYPKKTQGKIQWCGNALPHRPEPDERGLLAMKHIGTGFLMIKRGVFEKMVQVYGEELDYLELEIDRPRYDFFPMRIVDKRYISEDWFFCDRCRQIGYTVYADTKVILKHIGSAVYPLESQILATHANGEREEIPTGMVSEESTKEVSVLACVSSREPSESSEPDSRLAQEKQGRDAQVLEELQRK